MREFNSLPGNKIYLRKNYKTVDKIKKICYNKRKNQFLKMKGEIIMKKLVYVFKDTTVTDYATALEIKRKTKQDYKVKYVTVKEEETTIEKYVGKKLPKYTYPYQLG